MNKEKKMIKILYAGDFAFINHTYVKGQNSWTSGQAFDERRFLMDTLAKDSEFDAEYLPTPYVSEKFPKTREEISKYDVILISDVGTDTLLLYPDLFKIPMGENRLKLIDGFARNGGGVMAVGGWMSFGGMMGQGKYHGTLMEDIFDIDVSPFDDRVEVPEGMTFNPVVPDHPLNKDVGWESSPLLFLGYNRFKARKQENVVSEYDGDPMMVARDYGKGRTLAFASDLAPHWGTGFVRWDNYLKFWQQCIRWLARRE